MYPEYSDEYYDLVDQMVATGRFGGRPEAAAEVRRLRPDLIRPTNKSRQIAMTSTPSGIVAGTSAERELDQLTRQQQQRKPHLTFAEAYVEVLTANSALYSRYLGERAAQQRNPTSG